MTTTAEACVEAYLQEQAKQQPVDKKTKKQRAALRKQVEALFADDALLLLGRAQLSEINAAGKYALPLSELAALPRLKSLLKNQDGEALIRAALEDSELVSISDACVERPLAQDLVQQYDAQLRRHVSYIFSDDGLQSCPPGKLRSMLDEDENTLFLPLASVVDIKKIKELLKNEADKVDACRAAIDAAEPGTLICRVEDHEQGPRVVRTQDLPDEIWELLESNPAGGRAVAVTNIRGKDAPALRLAFAKVGTIEAVELGEDERGAPTASIIFDEELGAIRAVEELNDEDNWRFGMRVRLESGMAPSAARKAAGLPPRPKEKKPQFNERCATEGSSRAAAPPPPPIPVVPVPVIVEEIPEGRQRGKLVYLKEGKFGFIRPRDAKSKDDHAFFNMNELPKNLKLKLGDYLEYTPATGEPKNGAPGKPRATKVERAPRPKKPSKKQLEDAAEAARVAALAAAALERRNAPPVSKLEALALRVEERRSTSESAEVDEAEERPDRLRSRTRGCSSMLSDVSRRRLA
mmetsp:Transcript_22827/g.70330  ORF Transcript_22827/g.70330 Transcript_22827/m.70330 type:complete len:522 (-) Transcript_22827:249-1814(-)